jgi:hypothetical protein
VVIIGYLHIPNLYKNQDILKFKECYALEKIHGTSAHLAFKDGQLRIFSGGEKHSRFEPLFNQEELLRIYKENFVGETVTLFGEAYGGKQQGMSDTYGKELKFIVFDVKIGDSWLCVPYAEKLAQQFGLEFIHYNKIFTDMNSINAERDFPSIQAVRNGLGNDKIREGVVLRPLIEVVTNNGKRVISKHKRAEFCETRTPREVNPEDLKKLTEAKAIVNEWVTLERLKHVLDKLTAEKIKTCDEYTVSIKDAGAIIKAITDDIYREAEGEIEKNKNTQTQIGKHTALLFKKYLNSLITDGIE